MSKSNQNITKEDIDRVKDAECIVKTISDFVDLKKTGAQYIGLSPFNDEKTPSFTVSKTKNIWKCFSSGKGGNDSISFLMALNYTFPESINYIADKYSIPLSDDGLNPVTQVRLPNIKKKSVEENTPYFFTIEELKETLNNYNKNTFVKFLINVFGKKKAEKAITTYSLGTKKNGVVYWQIDRLGKIRAAKVMNYNLENGSSKGQAKPYFIKPNEIKKNQILKQCFFGEHITSSDLTKSIGIVESEKTAIICSLYFDSYLWLASGGLANLSEYKLQPFKNRSITLFPDLQAFEEWEKKAQSLKNSYDIKTSTLLKRVATKEMIDKKADLADLVISLVKKERFTEGTTFSTQNEIDDCSKSFEFKGVKKEVFTEKAKLTKKEEVNYYVDNPFLYTGKFGNDPNALIKIAELDKIYSYRNFVKYISDEQENIVSKKSIKESSLKSLIFYYNILFKAKRVSSLQYLSKFEHLKSEIEAVL